MCDDSCIGLMRCTGTSFFRQTCCNYFDLSGSCVETCPLNSSPNNATFECECDQGYGNTPSNLCEIVRICDPNPCENGGTCTEVSNNFTCTCSPGHACECDPNPCGNGDNCTDLIATFSCACAPGFAGETCTTSVNQNTGM